MAAGLLPGNPAAGVKLPISVREHLKKGGKDRVLSDEEIRTLWEQLDYVDAVARRQNHLPITAPALELILLTGQARGGLLRAVARHRGQDQCLHARHRCMVHSAVHT